MNWAKTPLARKTYDELKVRLHRKLLDAIDLNKISRLEDARIESDVRRTLEEMVMAEPVALSHHDRQRLVIEIENEVFGLGPLEALMKDSEISDILVNNCGSVYIERHGKLEETDVRFRDDAHLMQIIERIVTRVGRRVDEHSPMVDARLPDGSRVNAIIPPLALDGPILSIRRFGAERLTMNDLVRLNSIPPHIAEVLEACVKARLNILISGGTGSGKTTLLNCLSNYIPATERIVTIEDSAELKLQQRHVLRLETRPPNIEGTGMVTQRDLVRNALRMRPDRIVVGEVRGGEALDMMQAMNTGHDGSITTVHCNSPRDALARLETMCLMSGMDLGVRAIREQVSSAIQLIIHQSRMKDGTRRITHITEIVGMEGDVITLQDLFLFDYSAGVDSDGKFLGTLKSTGLRPHFIERMQERGIAVTADVFAPVPGGRAA
jgi:pilus assembly protein CpaF